MAREHCDSYLYYIRYKTIEKTSSQTPFQDIFNQVKEISPGTFYRTIHPQNVTLSIQDVFRAYMQRLIEFIENQDTPLYRPSHLQELRHRSEYFEVPDLDTKVQRHDNPHYWLRRDILQRKKFSIDSLATLFLRMTLYLKSKFLLSFFKHFSDLTINYFMNRKINKLTITSLKY